MAAISGNFSIVRGDTYTESWQVNANGSPTDITGAKFYMTFKNSYDDADPGALQLSSPSGGITIDDAAAGKVTLKITKTQTNALNVQTYVYDICMFDANGDSTTFVEDGRVTIKADVTRATS